MHHFIKFLIVLSVLVSTLAGIIPYTAVAYSGVPHYFTEEISRADKAWGILPNSLQGQILTNSITRGEFCEIIILAYQRVYGRLPAINDTYFTDTNSRNINSAYSLGIVSGYPDGTFRENNLITRQEMFQMINNFMYIRGNDRRMDYEYADSILSSFSDRSDISDWATISSASMVHQGVVKGNDMGMIDPRSNTSSAQAIVLAYRSLVALTGLPDGYYGEEGLGAPWNYDEQNRNYRDWGRRDKQESLTPLTDLGKNNAKYELVFGSLDHPGYKTSAEAAANMVTIKINVWKLGSSGVKTPGTFNLTVNKAIATTVQKIFQEIYDGPEQFPIKNVGGYAWRTTGTSEHAMGLAIDINSSENYMIKADGTVVAGSYWKPGVDPYSIPENGDVVKAFAKYGFAWGGNAWRSANDYMHFSYFGE